ncbi:MAG: hypothetical protein KAG37_06305, partial [Flavobacteriales bacterium]|nr:hypothetical protein [Flavobacteriales bacterium]
MKTFLKFLTIIGLFALISSCEHTTQKSERRIKAVPKSAFMIFEAEDMGNAFDELYQNSLWQIIEKEESLNLIGDQLRSLNDFLNKNKVSVESDKILLSLHKTGAKSFDYLVYLDAEDVNVESIIGFGKYKVSTKEYDNANIAKYSLPGVSTPIHVCNYKGIFIFSRSTILIENSVRQLNSGMSLMNDKNFKSLYNSINPKEDFNVLINMPKLSSLSTWASQKEVVLWTAKFSDWIELDVSPEEDEVFFNGIASTNDSIGHFLGVFKNLNASAITIDELLPSATSFSVSYGIENFPKYYRSYTEYLRKNGKLQRFKITQKAYKIPRSDLFDSWIDDQFTLASIT